MKITFLDEIPSLKKVFFEDDDSQTRLKEKLMTWDSCMGREDRITTYVSLFNMCATYNWSKEKCMNLIAQNTKDKSILESMVEFVYQRLEGVDISPKRIKKFEMPLGMKEPQVLVLYRFMVALWEYLDDYPDLSLKMEALKYFNQLDKNHRNYIILDRIYEYDFYLPKLTSSIFHNGECWITYDFSQTPVGKKSLLNLQIFTRRDNQTLDDSINEFAYSSKKLKTVEELFWIQKVVRTWTRTYYDNKNEEKRGQDQKYETLFSKALKRSERWSKSDARNSITSLDYWITGCLEQDDDLSIEYVRYKIINDLYAPLEKEYFENKKPWKYTTENAMASRLYKPLKEIRNITTHTEQKIIKDKTLFKLLLCIGLRYIHESFGTEMSKTLLEEERELCAELEESWNNSRNFENEAREILWKWYLCLMNASGNRRHRLVSTDNLIRDLKYHLDSKRNHEVMEFEREKYDYEWMIKWLCIKITSCRVENINFSGNEAKGTLAASFYSSEMNRLTPMLFELIMAYLKYALCKEETMNEKLTIYL